MFVFASLCAFLPVLAGADAAKFSFDDPPGTRFTDAEKEAQRARGRDFLPMVKRAFEGGAGGVRIPPDDYRFGRERQEGAKVVYPLGFEDMQRDAGNPFTIDATAEAECPGSSRQGLASLPFGPQGVGDAHISGDRTGNGITGRSMAAEHFATRCEAGSGDPAIHDPVPGISCTPARTRYADSAPTGTKACKLLAHGLRISPLPETVGGVPLGCRLKREDKWAVVTRARGRQSQWKRDTIAFSVEAKERQ